MKSCSILISIGLLACNRDREFLGDFDEARRMLIVSSCMARDSEDLKSKTRPDFSCRFLPRQSPSFDPPGCPCRGYATLHRANNGTEASLLQIQIDHCPHAEAVGGVMNFLDWLVSPDHHSRLKQDLDELGRSATTSTTSVSSGTISAVRIYGDRAVEIKWSRDAFRQRDGSITSQPTESLFVAIRPRTDADATRVSADKELRVSPVPSCR